MHLLVPCHSDVSIDASCLHFTYAASLMTVVLIQSVSFALENYSMGITYGTGSSHKAEQENSDGGEDLHCGC